MSLVGALSEAITGRAVDVAKAVGRATDPHIAHYPIVRGDEPKPDLVALTIVNLVDRAVSGEVVTEDDLSFFRSFGQHVADRGAPLAVLLEVSDVALTTLIQQVWRSAPPGSYAEMTQLTNRLARIGAEARQTCITAYLEAGRARGGPLSTRRLLAEALVDGAEARSAAQATSHRLARSYLVLRCEVAGPEMNPAQRTQVHREIESLPGVLHCGDPEHLTVLIPLSADQAKAEATAAALVSRLHKLTGRFVYAACAYRREISDIPAAAQEADQVVALVRAIPDAECRPYRADEMLVELAILAQSDIRDRLAAMLVPLDAGTELRRTLEVLFACGLDRERAAKALCIHRRTLWYRMDRIRKLAGIDPDTAHGLGLLRAALTAARMAETPPGFAEPESATADPAAAAPELEEAAPERRPPALTACARPSALPRAARAKPKADQTHQRRGHRGDERR